ncbi:hypothetical protein KIN20_006796 [Parelaphostrongylus tenuis]|uniref:Uncharacterized protein n=1 Tax=Parelaphostrongylus tenuis TaxID=148309 RepID=A0AAD5M4A2_PARTN|nr:hypothetical protein KIN20_006796 [Parelaphostrongylus tenuis]
MAKCGANVKKNEKGKKERKERKIKGKGGNSKYKRNGKENKKEEEKKEVEQAQHNCERNIARPWRSDLTQVMLDSPPRLRDSAPYIISSNPTAITYIFTYWISPFASYFGASITTQTGSAA